MFRALFAVIVLFTISYSAVAQRKIVYKPDPRYTGQAVWDFPGVKEASIDIGLWALIVAREYDSTVDVQANLVILDSMAAEIRRMLAGRTRDFDKLLAVRMFMFDPGPWNGNHPFTYDLDDPRGRRTENKLLSTYLKTRKGNCVSMPTLTLALMERIDPNVQLYGGLAPRHVFCRYHDRQTKDAFNFEPANGGTPARNEWMIEESNISQAAVDKGTYLRDLTKKEFVTILMETLVIKHRRAEAYRDALRYADLMVKIAPNLISPIMMKMTAQMDLHDVYAYRNRAWKRGEAPALTTAEREEWRRLHEAVIIAMKKIDDMGWVEETEEQRRAYLQRIEEEKTRRGENE